MLLGQQQRQFKIDGEKGAGMQKIQLTFFQKLKTDTSLRTFGTAEALRECRFSKLSGC